MAIVKLTEAGESLTWQIKDAQEVPGNFGQQVKFDDANSGDAIYLPLDSAMRQLDRLGMSVADCVGATLTISRDPNPKPGAKPYWGIRVASPAPAKGKYIRGIDGPELPPDEGYGVDPHEHFPPHQANTRVPSVAPKAADKMAVARSYLDLLAWVRTQEPTKGMSDEAQQAAAATVFIAWQKAGLA